MSIFTSRARAGNEGGQSANALSARPGGGEHLASSEPKADSRVFSCFDQPKSKRKGEQEEDVSGSEACLVLGSKGVERRTVDLFELDVLWWADPAAGEWCCELELWVRLDMGGCWG